MNGDGAGAAEWLLALIGAHGDGIREALDEGQYALLLTRLEALAGTAPDEERAVRRALQGVRLALLALPRDHPVYAALDSPRLVAATPPGPGTVPVAQELLRRLRIGPPAHETAYVDEELEQLRQASGLSADEARARCGGPPPPELIRLRDPDAGERYPEFQFTEGGGSPYEVVLEVNRLLLAEIDPWGAAAWWLGVNTWLGGTPASLLGRLPDHRLVGAAGALAEGE
ncbi:hypothetical protein A6P39_013140 [Streptomyces sp. FXJ1.172]|uniref:hypothetical protein n=1 Tax=Streptomyces sp. FXJ1.172 TaxID=710705 RepID=UPI0007CFB7E2|nr:hypothetical protein [Streptomyces sp. FXJ1.172]WEO94882.1 hypothetical protein A6P39_013140 [Streptomyces sp. FXJ1.172]